MAVVDWVGAGGGLHGGTKSQFRGGIVNNLINID